MAHEQALEAYRELPSAGRAFAPIIVPIVLIAFGSIASFPSSPLGDGTAFTLVSFLGEPLNALIAGLLLSLTLLPEVSKTTTYDWIEDSLKAAATIVMITGAGGALGAVLKATQIGDTLGQLLAY